MIQYAVNGADKMTTGGRIETFGMQEPSSNAVMVNYFCLLESMVILTCIGGSSRSFLQQVNCYVLFTDQNL